MATMTFAQALNLALHEEMEKDRMGMIIGEDIGAYGGIYRVTKDLLQRFGEKRVRSTPISESGIIGSALGAALTGTRTIAELMYIDFAACAMDQIINQVAKIRYMSGGAARVPLVIRTQGGGGRGNAAQHSQSLEALFFHIPGLKIVMPSTPCDARGLLKTSIRSDDPVMFIEHKLLYETQGEVPEEEYALPLGKAAIRKPGRDISVVATSYMVLVALEAADQLAGEGIDLEVIDPRSLVPLDTDCIVDSVKKTGRLIVIHEGCKRGGIGAEIACQVMEAAFDYLDAPIARIGAWDVPIPYSLPLENAVIPDAESVKTAARELVGGGSGI